MDIGGQFKIFPGGKIYLAEADSVLTLLSLAYARTVRATHLFSVFPILARAVCRVTL